MRTIVIEPEYEEWRTAARQLLAQSVKPDEVLWSDDPQEASEAGSGLARIPDREVGRSELATEHITVLSGKREGELQVIPEPGGFPEQAQRQALRVNPEALGP